MQSSCKSASGLPRIVIKQVNSKPTTNTSNMAFFPRNFYATPEPASFTPIFRLLDDFDNFARQSQGYQVRKHVPTFQPKFDVREVDGAYELHGELSGLKKEDVQ